MRVTIRSCSWLLFLAALAARGATLQWDADTATPGAQDGAGAWDDTSTNWWDGIANTNWTTATPDDAILGGGGTPGPVTVASPVSIGNLAFLGAYVITGSTINLAASSVVTAAAPGVIASTLAGGGLTKDGAAALTLYASNTYAGGTLVRAGQIAISNDAAFGTGPVTIDGGSISRDGAGAVLANPISIGAAGGAIAGRTVVDNYMTLTGPLTGAGALSLTGLVSLSNATNTFSGPITLSATNTYLRLAVNNALSNNPITFAGTGRYLTLAAGTTSTVGSLTGVGGHMFNQSALPATLLIGGGNQSGVYGGSAANGGGPMHLVKIGTGTQEFSTAVGTSQAYGSLTVREGLLVMSGAGYPANATGGNGNGTPVLVQAGATLQISAFFNAGHTRSITVDGGVLQFSLLDATGGNGGDCGNYVNNLTVANGARIIGNRQRVGYQSAPTTTVTGASASTNAAGVTLVVLGASPYTLDVADVTATPAQDYTIAGLISDFPALGGMPLLKTGPGSLLLTASNQYAGATTIAQGALLLRHAQALGSATGAVVLGTAATGTNLVELALAQTTGDLFFARPMLVTTNGTGPAQIGGRHTGGRSFLDGRVTLQRDVVLLAAGNDRTQFRGGLTGTGNVTIVGGSRVTWSTTAGATEFGNGAADYSFAGGIALSGTNTVLQLNSDFTNGAQSLAAKNVAIGPGAILRLPYDADAAINALSGTGTVEAYAPGGGTPGNTLILGAGGGSATFDGLLINTGGAVLSPIKAGAGTQVLTRASTYTGPTFIDQGVLALAGAGAISGTPVIAVASGAVFDVSAVGFTLGPAQTLRGAGLVTGAVGAAAGARVLPGATNGPGTLTVAGSLTEAAGVTNWFDLSSVTNAGNDQLVVQGDFAPAGATVALNPLAPLATGAYVLVTYSGAKTGSFDPVLRGAGAQSRFSLSLDETGTPNQVSLVVAGAAAQLTWASTTSSAWDVQASTNWLNGGTLLPDAYFQGDHVRFDDTPGVTTTVSLAGGLLPGSVTVDASTNAFTLTGPGSIGGAIAFTKSGTNVLTISATNSYAGATTISNGALAMANNAALGVSSVSLADGAALVRAGGATQLGSPVALAGGTAAIDDGGAAFAVTNVIAGGGQLAKRGAGTLTLPIANSFTGGVQVLGGTLAIGVPGALGSGRAEVRTNATLAIGALAITNPVTLAGGALALSGAATYTMPITLATGSVGTLRAAGNYVAISGAIDGGGGLLVTGTGTPGVQLVNPLNSFQGNVDIAGGTFLRLTASEVIPDTAVVNVQSNGNLRLEGGGLVETVAGLTGLGWVWIPTSSDNHTLRVGAGDVSSVFDGVIGPTNQHTTITLVKIGAGRFTLSNTNPYSGPTWVSNGALVVNGVTGTNAVNVDTGGTLGGTGVIRGALSLGGILDPGDGIGTLTVSNIINCTGTAVTRIELGATNNYDQLVCSDFHSLAGKLEVVTTNGYVPATGDTFQVVVNTGLGGLMVGLFDTTSLPALGGGLGWDVAYSPASVSLTVTGSTYTPTPYEAWAAQIPNPALRGDQEDADGDGYANLWEYSQGTDPTNSASGLKVRMSRTNGVHYILFNRATNAMDLIYAVEAADLPTNNATWTMIASNVLNGTWSGSSVVSETATGDVRQVSAADDVPASTNRALRVRVTRP